MKNGGTAIKPQIVANFMYANGKYSDIVFNYTEVS